MNYQRHPNGSPKSDAVSGAETIQTSQPVAELDPSQHEFARSLGRHLAQLWARSQQRMRDTDLQSQDPLTTG